MTALLATIKQECYPAWNSGDAERFETTARELFAPDVASLIWGTPRSGLEGLLGVLLADFESWRPQEHSIIREVAGGETAAAWQYHWTATHAGTLRLPNGHETPATGRQCERFGIVIARREGDKITSWRAFSTYPEILVELTGVGPGAVLPAENYADRARTISRFRDEVLERQAGLATQH